jgi:hypothetical protein
MSNGEEISTCFTDENFNGGTPGSDWGWSIDVVGESGLGGCTGCEIWAESDCTRTTGYMVGTADFSRHYATIVMDNDYVVESADLYAGKCEGNDGGDAHSRDCGCDQDTVAAHASNTTSFPIQKSFPTRLGGYTFTDHDVTTDQWGGDSYMVFPLDAPNRQYVSGHLRVCPCPPSV